MKFISCQKRVFAPEFDTALFVRVTKSLCESPSCPVDLITPPDDCHVNYTLSFSLQVRFYYFYFISCKEFFLLSLYKILLLDALMEISLDWVFNFFIEIESLIQKIG